MLSIYHNPRCSKSRMALKFLEDLNLEFKTIKYLNDPLSKKELIDILEKLNYKPIELIRKNEAIWKSDFKTKALTDEQVLNAMIDYPKLIERPIVINGNKAVVARPIEKINDVF